jgi:hypothetical protein
MSAGSKLSPIWFPLLAPGNHGTTSDRDDKYNCIAWAAGHHDKHWWPDEDGVGFWPIDRREETVECFMSAFESLGYERCSNDDPAFEAGFEKVAIFAKGDEPTHAALQKPNGRWTSKMGTEGEDIEHDWGVLDGPSYGRAVRVLRRPVPPDSSLTPAPIA